MPSAHANGAELFYLEVGKGVPCLVMHGGLGVDHTQFRDGLDPLGDVLRLVYYDHRSNGRSGRPPIETLTLERSPTTPTRCGLTSVTKQAARELA